MFLFSSHVRVCPDRLFFVDLQEVAPVRSAGKVAKTETRRAAADPTEAAASSSTTWTCRSPTIRLPWHRHPTISSTHNSILTPHQIADSVCVHSMLGISSATRDGVASTRGREDCVRSRPAAIATSRRTGPNRWCSCSRKARARTCCPKWSWIRPSRTTTSHPAARPQRRRWRSRSCSRIIRSSVAHPAPPSWTSKVTHAHALSRAQAPSWGKSLSIPISPARCRFHERPLA